MLQGKNKEIEKTVSQLKTAQVSLATKNAENELLLKEIHHRVKNNLEVVSSLLALQSARISDLDVQDGVVGFWRTVALLVFRDMIKLKLNWTPVADT